MTTKFDYTDAKEQITVYLRDLLNLEVIDIKIKNKCTVYVAIKDTGKDCPICKRFHTVFYNRTTLTIYG